MSPVSVRSDTLRLRWERARAILDAHSHSGTVPTSATLAADAQSVAIELVQELGLRRLIELGSGVSTVALARAAKAICGAVFFSLEHEHTYAEATETLLSGEGLSDVVHLIHAPIRLRKVGSYVGLCYAPRSTSSWPVFDFALIDGPPARTGGRFMTLPLLWPFLTEGAIVLLDDAGRADLEGIWLQEWKRIFGESLGLSVDLGFAKGLALLMKTDRSRAPATDWPIVRKYWVIALKGLLRPWVSRLHLR